MQPEGFHDLVRRAQAGDREATDQLLAAVRPHLMYLARDFADPQRPDESVSDLVQEVEINAWQKLDQFRGATTDEETLAMFRAWLAQMVRNLGLNKQRDRGAQKRRPPQPIVRLQPQPAGESTSTGNALDPAASDLSPSKNAGANEMAQSVRDALTRLSDPADREIVRLRFFEGLSLRQIAPRLALSYDQVRERYQRAMSKLERELGGQA